MVADIRDFGAVADGVTLNTEAIQRAIDKCFECGGGRVLVEGGVYSSERSLFVPTLSFR